MSRLDLSALFSRKIQRVSLFGFGLSARAMLPHLVNSGYEVSVRDDRENISGVSGVQCYLGGLALSDLRDDLIIVSPSVRRDRLADAVRDKGILLTSDTDMFFRLFSGKSYAVTGSSGKSTTSTFLKEILSTRGMAHLIGNIGVPMTPTLLTESIETAVCEISSFNLQYDTVRPYRALITNIKRNHLNWHRDFREYMDKKLSLFSSSVEFAVNLDDEILKEYAHLSSAFALFSLKYDYYALQKAFGDKIIYTLSNSGIMRCERLIVPWEIIKDYPRYDIYNLTSALALSDGERDDGRLHQAVLSHSPLKHRREIFLQLDGIDYIDSSIDTSPDRTEETLLSLSSPVIILLGGKSKGENYATLIPELIKKCPRILVFGEAREKITREIYHPDLNGRIYAFDTLLEATLTAVTMASDGDTVLLSPASTSYDAFGSFEERGEYFKKTVKDATQG